MNSETFFRFPAVIMFSACNSLSHVLEMTGSKLTCESVTSVFSNEQAAFRDLRKHFVDSEFDCLQFAFVLSRISRKV